jgi:hypothetical protein
MRIRFLLFYGFYTGYGFKETFFSLKTAKICSTNSMI